MSGNRKFFLTFLSTALAFTLASSSNAQDNIKRAVYYDDTYATATGGWINQTIAQSIRDFFVGKGYDLVDADGLKTFMDARIADGVRSVVVFARDLAPDTVIEGTATAPSSSTTLRQYLNAGGRIVWAGDIPFYYQGHADSSSSWGDSGATTILGFNGGPTWDLNLDSTITDDGKKWGLTAGWKSGRAEPVGNVDIILAKPNDANASGWVKRYAPGDNFGGFVRILDNGAIAPTDDELADLYAVASYVPAGGAVVLPRITGKVTDASGKAISGAVIDAMGSTGSTFTTTNDQGYYYLYVAAGTYTVAPESINAGSKTVTVDASGQTVDFSGASLPKLSLATADLTGGASWQILREGTVFDFSPADPSYNQGTWETVSIPSDAQVSDLNGAYYFYRLKFTVPAEWGTADRGLIVDSFTVEDSDWTYFNGHFLGNIKWGTSTARRYFIPKDWVTFGGANTLVVKGQHGNGTGGFTGGSPVLHFASPIVGGVLVNVSDADYGLPAINSIVSLVGSDGKVVTTGQVREAGKVFFGEVAAGDYQVRLETGPAVANSTPVTASVKVEAGKVAEATLAPQLRALLPNATASAQDDDFSASKLDPKWTSLEIGDAGGSSASIVNGQLDINAAGANIYDASDNFHYVYQKVSGDFVATVKVIQVPAAATLSKAALQVRATTDPDSVEALIYESPTVAQQYGSRFQWRPTKGATTSGGTVGLDQPGLTAPVWLSLVRSGSAVTAYFSTDGKHALLEETGTSVSIPDLPTDALIGIAWASRGSSDDALFDDFTVRSLPTVSTVKKGDLNGDGKVNVQDATLSLRVAVGLVTPTADQKTAGDVNGDGKLNVQDTTLILQVAVGLKSGF